MEQLIGIVRQCFEVFFGQRDCRQVLVRLSRYQRRVILDFDLFGDDHFELHIEWRAALRSQIDLFGELREAFDFYGQRVAAGANQKAIPPALVGRRRVLVALAVIKRYRRRGDVRVGLVDYCPAQLDLVCLRMSCPGSCHRRKPGKQKKETQS